MFLLRAFCWLVLLSAMQAQTVPPAWLAYATSIPLDATLVYHPQRQVSTVFDRESGRIWEWDGSQFHPLLGVTLTSSSMFWVGHGLQCIALDGTTWDGASFGRMPLPQGVTSFGWMAHDRGRDRLVAISNALVFEWDGSQWLRIRPSAMPPFQRGLVYSPEHGCCVLAAGRPLTLFAWQGDEWAVLDQTFPDPGMADNLGLGHDPQHQRLLLHGQVGTAAVVAQTWSFAAGSWQAVPTPAALASQPSNQIARLHYDGQGMLRFLNHGEFWRLEGSFWRRLPFDHPGARSGVSCASSPNFAGVMVYGGFAPTGGGRYGDTWWFDGRWQRLTPGISPPPRGAALLAWSPVNQAFLLHGGSVLGGQLNDTWLFDGLTWRQQQPATTPDRLVAMVGDATAGILAISAPGQSFGRLWRWSGLDWLPVPNSQLPVVHLHGCSFFPPRGSLVAAGDYQLWEWDGLAWNRISYISDYRIHYRPDTQRLLLSGSNSSVRAMEWDGTQLLQPATTQTFAIAGGAPDFVRNRLFCFGSTGLQAATDSRAAFYVTANPSTVDRIGYGCGLGAVPGLLTLGIPRPGTNSFGMVAETFAPNAACLWTIGLGQQAQHLGGGCVAWMANAPVLQLQQADLMGRARYSLPLPAGTDWLGVTLMAQAFAVAPTASPIGSVVATDLLRITLGD